MHFWWEGMTNRRAGSNKMQSYRVSIEKNKNKKGARAPNTVSCSLQERGAETPAELRGCSSAAVPTVGPCSSRRALGSGQKPACFPKFTAGQRSRAAAGWRRSSALPRLCRQELSCGWACSAEDEEHSPAPQCQISLTIACFSIHCPQPRAETGSG